MIAAAIDGDAVRRRVRVAEARRAIQLEPEAAGGRASPGGVAEAPGVSHPLEDLRVAQGDLAGLARVDRKDAGAEQAVPGKLDQRRVPLAAHDLLINRACLGGVHWLALELTVALPQREVAENGFAGERVQVAPFVHHRPGVAEPFLHRHPGDPPGDGDLDGAAYFFDRSARLRTDGLHPALSECPGRDRQQQGARQREGLIHGQHCDTFLRGMP